MLANPESAHTPYEAGAAVHAKGGSAANATCVDRSRGPGPAASPTALPAPFCVGISLNGGLVEHG